MAKHAKLPGWVPLKQYMDIYVLRALETLAWLAVDEESPLGKNIEEYLPVEDRQEYLDAIKEIGVIAQEAQR